MGSNSHAHQQWPSSFESGISYLSRSFGDPRRKPDVEYVDPLSAIFSPPAGVAEVDGEAPRPVRGRAPSEIQGKIHDIDEEKAPLLPVDEDLVATSSFAQSLFNSCNILLGVGILSLPFALSESGWCGLIILAFLAAVTNYTGKVISLCMADRPNIRSYPEIGQAAFGDVGRLIISAVLYTELFLTLSLFFILEGTNLKNLFYDANDPDSARHRNFFMIVTAIVVLPSSWLRNLSALAYVSVLGIFASLFLLGVVIFDFVDSGPQEWSLEKTTFFTSWSQLPIAFGVMGFGFAGHAVFPSIYSSMRVAGSESPNPARFALMLNTTYTIVMLAYATMAVVGYAQYGPDVEEQITLNLPANSLLSTIATALIVVNPITKFALTLNPIGLAIEELVVIKRRWLRRLFRVTVRTLLVVGALLCAMVVPYFAYVVSFIGALMSMAVSAVFPSLCYLKMFHGRLRWYEVGWNYIVIVVGTLCGAIGAWTAGIDIIDEIRKHNHP